MSFTGFSEETFLFLFEIGLNNDKEFYNANKDRYKKYVQQPMRELAAELLPFAQSFDPLYDTNLNRIVSRIRRDTRFTYDKSPYRDHMWLSFRYPDMRISESFSIYFQIRPDGYDYGVGFYSAGSEFMANYRKKLLSDPAGFLKTAKPLTDAGFIYAAEPYKRQHFPDAPDEIKPFVNVKSFIWKKDFKGVRALLAPSDIEQRLISEWTLLKPMYDYARKLLP